MALYNELTKPGNFPHQFVCQGLQVPHSAMGVMCGAIPSSFRTSFRDLGLGSTDASVCTYCTCAKKLHLHPIYPIHCSWIDKRYTHRQALQALQARTGAVPLVRLPVGPET